jgi:hypothetical protein
MKIMSEDEFQEMFSYNVGYCSTCNEITIENGIEPDAEGYECEICKNHTVIGLENAVLTGQIMII